MSGRQTSDVAFPDALGSGARKAMTSKGHMKSNSGQSGGNKIVAEFATASRSIEGPRRVPGRKDNVTPRVDENKLVAKEQIDVVDVTNSKLLTMSLSCNSPSVSQSQEENKKTQCSANGHAAKVFHLSHDPKIQRENGTVEEAKHLSWAERAKVASTTLHYTAKRGSLVPTEMAKNTDLNALYIDSEDKVSESNDDRASVQQQSEDKIVPAVSQQGMVRFIPRGMENPGNLCFVNAILQALMACSDFCALMSSLANKTPDLDAYPNLLALARLSQEFRRESLTLAEGSWQGLDIPIKSKDNRGDASKVKTRMHIRSVHCSLIMQFVLEFMPAYRAASVPAVAQEDAHEFLQFLLDALHSEHSAHGREIKGEEKKKDDNSSCCHRQNLEEDDDGWLVKSGKRKVRQQEVSAISELDVTPLMTTFQGKIAVSVATASAPVSQTLHPFWIIELPILSESIRSVADALDALTASEVISGYRPSKDARPQEATKSERILRLPNVLILHLMRFQYSGSSSKLNKFVAYEQKLAVRPSWLDPGCSQRNSVYKLVATVSHHGKAISSGHFTADVLQPNGDWLRCDDDNLYYIPEKQVLSDRPYLLFYERIKNT